MAQPTITGATAAGRVLGRVARSQALIGLLIFCGRFPILSSWTLNIAATLNRALFVIGYSLLGLRQEFIQKIDVGRSIKFDIFPFKASPDAPSIYIFKGGPTSRAE
jgi:hypothetical protein